MAGQEGGARASPGVHGRRGSTGDTQAGHIRGKRQDALTTDRLVIIHGQVLKHRSPQQVPTHPGPAHPDTCLVLQTSSRFLNFGASPPPPCTPLHPQRESLRALLPVAHGTKPEPACAHQLSGHPTPLHYLSIQNTLPPPPSPPALAVTPRSRAEPPGWALPFPGVPLYHRAPQSPLPLETAGSSVPRTSSPASARSRP